MREEIEKIKYENCDIKIYRDEDYQSPDEWENEEVFLVSFHPDFDVRREGFSKEVCKTLIGIDDGQSEPEVEIAKGIKKKYHFFGLEAYVHSGVWLALSYEGDFPDRRWDVSQCGLVFVSKEETRNKEKAKKIARSLIEEWNDCLSGNVYGYITEHEGEHIDSCWGFYGDYNENGMISEAKNNIDIWILHGKQPYLL